MKDTTISEKSFDSSIRFENVIFGSSEFDEKYFNHMSRTSPVIHKPIFIIGSPRSGTTMLGKCLGAHRSIASSEESLFLLHMWRIFSDLYKGENVRNTSPLQEYLSSEELLKNIAVFSDSLFYSLIAKENKTIYLDHTPWYGSIASFIKVLYPDARFIHVIRDGRQVVRSLTHSYEGGYKWAGSSIEHRINIWKGSVENCFKIKEKYPENYYEILYEDIINEPENAFAKLCEYLDVDYDTNILKPLSVGHSTPSSSSFDPQKKYLDYNEDGWPLEWNKEDVEKFENLGGNLMKKIFK